MLLQFWLFESGGSNQSGRLHDDLSLRLLYAAADLYLIPFSADNLPRTGFKPLARPTPVVAFGSDGLVDIVDVRVTTALAELTWTLEIGPG